MFTGIIEETGTVTDLRPAGEGTILEVEASGVLEGLKRGDSISVDGCCLSALRVSETSFGAFLSAETMKRSIASKYMKGSEVNLERAVRAADRLEGHIVQGHVDGTANILALSKTGYSSILRVALPHSLSKYVAEKGSVAVNGVSLTVSGLGEGYFEAALIPLTLENCNLKNLGAGDRINLEMDILAKYIARITGNEGDELNEDFLSRHGFLD